MPRSASTLPRRAAASEYAESNPADDPQNTHTRRNSVIADPPVLFCGQFGRVTVANCPQNGGRKTASRQPGADGGEGGTAAVRGHAAVFDRGPGDRGHGLVVEVEAVADELVLVDQPRPEHQ